MKDYYIGFKIAWGMLSTIPILTINEFKKGYNGYASAMYPLVGLLLALLLNLSALLLENHLESWHLYIVLFVLWVYSYGAIHLDGVSDVYDGMKSYAPKEKLLEIMKDPRIGSLGFVFTFLLMLLKLSAFVALGDVSALLFVMMLSRYGVLFIIFFFNSDGDMSTASQSEFTPMNFGVATATVLLFGLLFQGLSIILWMAFVGVLAIIIAKRLLIRFDKLNGDMYGYSIEWLEVAMLYVLLLI